MLHLRKTTDNSNIHITGRPAAPVGMDISGGPNEDVRQHEILGLTYRVKICSSSFKRSREFARTSRAPTKHSPPYDERPGHGLRITSGEGGRGCGYLKVQITRPAAENEHHQIPAPPVMGGFWKGRPEPLVIEMGVPSLTPRKSKINVDVKTPKLPKLADQKVLAIEDGDPDDSASSTDSDSSSSSSSGKRSKKHKKKEKKDKKKAKKTQKKDKKKKKEKKEKKDVNDRCRPAPKLHRGRCNVGGLAAACARCVRRHHC